MKLEIPDSFLWVILRLVVCTIVSAAVWSFFFAWTGPLALIVWIASAFGFAVTVPLLYQFSSKFRITRREEG